MGVMRITLPTITLVALLLWNQSIWAQNDPESQYKFGVDLIEEGKYDLAMEVFKPLASHNSEFQYRAEAAYYFAIAAKKGGYLYQARQMMIHSVTQFEDWENIDDSYILLTEVYFEQGDYLNACASVQNLKDKGKREYGREMKVDYLNRLRDTDSLKNLYYSFPGDREVGIRLAKVLSLPPFEPGDEMLLENIIDFFELDPESFNMATKRVAKKDIYNVAVLLPFKWKLTRENSQYFKNKFAYSIYTGILKAADTLSKQGFSLMIRPYDTEQSTFAVEEILKDSSLGEADLIIGPMYPHLSRKVMEYGRQRRINVVNPLSKNLELIEGNPYGYLFQVPIEVSATRLAQLAKDSAWYDDSISHPGVILQSWEKDSALLESYLGAFISDTTFRLDSILMFDPSDQEQISNYIHRDTLDSISISHIYIPTNNKALVNRVLSSAAKVDGQFPILGHSAWAEYNNISLEQLERRKVYFIYGDWLNWNSDLFWLLHGEENFDPKPDYYQALGYELLTYFGKSLHSYGKFFQQGLIKEGASKGVFFPGHDYSKGNYNSFAPLIRVRNNRFEWLNKYELLYQRD